MGTTGSPQTATVRQEQLQPKEMHRDDMVEMKKMREILDNLARRRLIIVTGKGGVGKSAVTAALGTMLAARGRRSLVLEVDPRENLHQLLDVAPSGGEVSPVQDHLWLQNLKPIQVADWVVRRQLKVEMLAQRVIKSPVYHRFVEGAPGLREMAIIGHALRLVRGDAAEAPQIQTVILDAPATGHGIYLLTAARLYADTIGQGPFAELARDIADFSADPQDTSVVMVTLAEEMPVQEALEMRETLDDAMGRSPELLVVNGIYPPVPEQEVEAGPDASELLDLWRRRRAVNERELRRLEQEWQGPAVRIPLLPVDRSAALISGLVKHLDQGHGLMEAPRVGAEGDEFHG